MGHAASSSEDGVGNCGNLSQAGLFTGKRTPLPTSDKAHDARRHDQRAVGD